MHLCSVDKCAFAAKEEKSKPDAVSTSLAEPLTRTSPVANADPAWPDANSRIPIELDFEKLAQDVVQQLSPSRLTQLVLDIFEAHPVVLTSVMQNVSVGDDRFSSSVNKDSGAESCPSPEVESRFKGDPLRSTSLSVSHDGPSVNEPNVLPPSRTEAPKQNRGNPRLSSTAPTLLQFGTSIYYAIEEETLLYIDVMRLGDIHAESSVRYATSDASAKAGYKYIAKEGVLEFAPGEISKNIEIEILSDDRWDATLEFSVNLSEAKNATLCDYLHKCRVKILDDDAFPTNKYKATFENHGLGDIPKMKLFYEYVKMGFVDPNIRRASIRCMLFDQCRNLHELCFLLLKLYLVDVVLDAENENDEFRFGLSKKACLLIICLLIIIPQTAISMMMVERVALRVGGMCRLKLQANLLRKFLNYDESLRTAVRISDLMLSITQHSPELVENGYLGFLDITREIGKMVLLFAYQFGLASSQGNHTSALTGVIPSIMFPVFMLVFLRIRHPKSDRLRLNMMLQQKKLASSVEIVVHSARMVIDFQRRAQTMDQIESQIKELNDHINLCRGNHVLNSQLSPWLTALIIGFYILFAGSSVVDGAMPLGAFLVTVDIYIRVAASWHVVYHALLIIHSALPSLELIFWHMNLDTDLWKRRDITIKRRELGQVERQRLREWRKTHTDEEMYSIELLPITMANVSFLYSEPLALQHELAATLKSNAPLAPAMRKATTQSGTSSSLISKKRDTLKLGTGISGISLEIAQGGLVAFVGKRGCGKSTLLRVLGGVLIPESGDFFVPPHLRVYHIEQSPIFFQATLLDNLTYGVKNEDDRLVERVLLVCRRLGISDNVLKHVSTGEIHDWDSYLSLTQRITLHLARAIIANPEALVFHKPTLCFDRDMSLRVLGVLKEFVRDRGIGLNDAPQQRRRRTCVITTTRGEGLEMMDQIFEVTTTGASPILAANVTVDMLD